MAILEAENIRLNQEVETKEEAIKLAGQLLVEGGYVDEDYISSMLEREDKVSTYMGNFVAIPHGTDESKDEIKKTGISLVQIPEGVNFGEEGEEDLVTVVFGIAGVGDEHLDVLSNIAVYCSEIENVVKLADADSAEEVMELLGGMD